MVFENFPAELNSQFPRQFFLCTIPVTVEGMPARKNRRAPDFSDHAASDAASATRVEQEIAAWRNATPNRTSSAVLANDNEAMHAQLHGAADVLRLAPESSLQQVSSFLAGGEVQVNVERSGGGALSLLEDRRYKAKVAGRSSRSRHARTTGSSNGQRQERDEFAKKRSRHAKTTSVHNYPAVFRSLLHLGTGAEEHPLAKGSELAEWAGLRQTRWYTAASYDGTFAYFWTLACNADPQNDGEGASPMFVGGTKLQTPAAQRPAFDPSAAKWAVGLNNEMFLWEHIPQFTHDGTGYREHRRAFDVL